MRLFSQILVIAQVLLLPLLNVSAAGLSVTPSSYEEVVSFNESTTRTLTVSNPTIEVSLIEVFPDDFGNMISLDPRSFTLEAGEQKKVTAFLLGDTRGIFSTFISVVARPLGERSFQTGSGIKIPITLTVEQGSSLWFPWWVYGIAIVDVVLLFVLVITVRHRKKRF